MFWLEVLNFKNIFRIRYLHFLYINDNYIISKLLSLLLPHTQIPKFRLHLMDTSFIASLILQDFPLDESHIVSIFFWFLETKDSTHDCICGLLLLSRAPQDSINTTIFKLFISSSLFFFSFSFLLFIFCRYKTFIWKFIIVS